MPRALVLPTQISAAIVMLLTIGGASAQTVWTGFTVNFSKPDNADPSDPENQDRITDNVILTRGNDRGLYNIAQESEYQFPRETSPSPVDTLWATAINNPEDTISASNWAALEFDTWRNAYGGGVGLNFNTPAVVHLVTDNVYLDLQITNWTSSFGGGFSYVRATGDLPPPPTTTGDYNGDDIVDAADYVLWRGTYGQTAVPPGSGADGDLSGVIDDPDYDFWAAHFGEIVPAAAAGDLQQIIPEPSTALCLLLGSLSAVGGLARRRSARRR